MNAEIIAVGSEMLTSHRLDTNSLYLTDELNALGIEVVRKCVIGDDLDRLADVVRRAAERSDLVILSGGLGPTEDDVTRTAVARALSRSEIFHPEIQDRLEERFRAIGRKMSEINRRQAYVVEGAEVLPNDRGTAPGQWIEEGGCVIVLLPGPPHELTGMFSQHCLPRLAPRAPKLTIQTLVLRVAGMPESDLDQLISPVYKKYENPVTTILAAAGDIQVRLRARCETAAEASRLLAEVAGPIEELLGDRVYSRNGEPLEVVTGQMLRRAKATLATAESCTGGLLAERVTSVAGSSEYFLGGFVTYSSRLKMELLGVSSDLLARHGAVSEQAAEAMATGARQRTSSDYALSITGVAGPGSGGEAVPVGTVFIGIADQSGSHANRRQFLGDRSRIRAFAVQLALDTLRRRLTRRL